MTTITNTGMVPVRVAGQYLQPGASLSVVDGVAARLMEANPDVVEAGKESAVTVTLLSGTEKVAAMAFAVAGSHSAGPTEDAPVAGKAEVVAPSVAGSTKRKK